MKMFILLLALALGGCATTGSEVAAVKPICDALGDPILVNTKNKNSTWHAGPSLAKRVYRNDDVARNLSCPGY